MEFATLLLSIGCFEPAKVVVGVEEGTLTEEHLQALADDCENGNEEACDQLDAIGRRRRWNSDPIDGGEEDDLSSDPSDWESWEDVDTSDPKTL